MKLWSIMIDRDRISIAQIWEKSTKKTVKIFFSPLSNRILDVFFVEILHIFPIIKISIKRLIETFDHTWPMIEFFVDRSNDFFDFMIEITTFW